MNSQHPEDQFNEVTKRVAEILQLEINDQWFVVDHKDNLALVHYSKDANMTFYGNFRGLLIDLEVGAILADSFGGYTPTATASKLNVVDNLVTIKDHYGLYHQFNINDMIIKRAFEGVVLRAIWHKGKMYLITHRRIDSSRSKWGSAKTFLSMYEEANGPKAEELFDITKPYSNTCYHFFIVDPSLLVATRQRVNKPYIVFLTQRTMDIKRPQEQVAPGKKLQRIVYDITSTIDEPIIYKPKKISIEEANKHLSSGYYEPFSVYDERESTGEAVIIYAKKNNKIYDIVKVHSPSYDWRSNMRNNNPSIIKQFYLLLDEVYKDLKTEEDWKRFKKRLILFPLYSEEFIEELFNETKGILKIPYTTPPSRELFNNRRNRIYLLWLNYFFSLPLSIQGKALKLFNDYMYQKSKLIRWIQNIEKNRTVDKDTDNQTPAQQRIKSIIKTAREKSKEFYLKDKSVSLDILIRNSISNFINKERGNSLYSLIREMNKEENALDI
ncbi:MAG: hypothetical protein QXG00_02505 [Candidatus Woesearchaeota archaeon]